MRRIGAVLAAMAVLAAACSSGGGDGEEAAPTTVADAPATTVAPETTTTTEPEPELLPVGAAWEPFPSLDVPADVDLEAVAVGDDVWFVGHRDNAPLALRSVEGGPPQP